jgi:lipase maturation factor 1
VPPGLSELPKSIQAKRSAPNRARFLFAAADVRNRRYSYFRMDWLPAIRRLFSSEQGAADHLIARWVVLRGLGLIYFSAFFSLVFQIRGLIGPNGILPADVYFKAIEGSFGPLGRLWFAPTLLWLGSGPHMLLAICWVGIAASILVTLNLWPRLTLVVCFVCFLSFVSAAQEFSGYQSDGMLLEMGCIALFFAPRGMRPGLGALHPPSRASLFLLQWEWFRIYFESGMAKLLSGDEEWRHLTAMDEYYQNGPLPTWIGWYAQHLPHWFHWSSALATLAIELVIVWMLFLPRPCKLVCWAIVTPWEAVVILTANYTFLNYLVLTLGFLLLDDRFFLRWMPEKPRRWLAQGLAEEDAPPPAPLAAAQVEPSRGRRILDAAGLGASCLFLSWIFYATTVELIHMPFHDFPLPTAPASALAPFRVANTYGLFAVMTRGRYEIEFQGSRDGRIWVAYPFRFKPQKIDQAPGIYAPYQPRFEWNLWFASLGPWRQNPLVVETELRLLQEDPQVLALFRSDPFAGSAPLEVRAMIWQYWFTSLAQKRTTGDWWRRELLGLYAPVLKRQTDGKIGVAAMPGDLPDHE